MPPWIDRPFRRLPAAVLALLIPLFAACSPMCRAVDAWTWGNCHADIHGGAVANVRSEAGTELARYTAAIDAARARIRALIVEDNLPGLSVAVGVDGDIVWTEGFGWAGIEEMLYLDDSCTGPLDAVRTYADQSLLFEPGTGFRHSSDGAKLVGAVIETAAGEPFLDFMQHELFDPLGMAATVRDDPAYPAAGATFFYWPFANLDTRTGIEHANNPDNSCQLGAAGLLTTPSDLVRFGAAVLDGRLIAPGMLEMLQTPLVLASGESTGHGLGWSVRQISIGPEAVPRIAYGADGRSAGGTTSFVTVPGHDVVIAVTANVSYARNLSALADGLAGLFAVGAR
jgi:CubicO group peptidase (beta-lactamase class C family)